MSLMSLSYETVHIYVCKTELYNKTILWLYRNHNPGQTYWLHSIE